MLLLAATIVSAYSDPPITREGAASCSTFLAGIPAPTNGGVSNTLVAFEHGGKQSLFARTWIDNAQAVGRWDGTTWHHLAAGMSNVRDILALRVLDDGSGERLYSIGGYWGGPNFILKWTGSEWVSADSRLIENAEPFISFDDGTGPAIYGYIVIGQLVGAVGRWTGSGWVQLGGQAD